MKKIIKIVSFSLLALIILVITGATFVYVKRSNEVAQYMELLGDEAPILSMGDLQVRDLNKNGRIDIYEDPTMDMNSRIKDVLSQMTIEEKAGTMFISMIGMTPEGDPMNKPALSGNPLDIAFGLMFPSSSEMVAHKLMNSFNIVHGYDAEILATFNNNIQKYAERTRLGIPVTIATDPRHGTKTNPGAAIYTSSFSQWPTSLGLAATRDTLLVREFGDIARQEYNAVGIKLALHPMADLSTEPRWGRTNGTFGEDAALSAMMTKAYVLGFQGNGLGPGSVACMTKHFSGGGPQKDGEDPHFPYGKEQAYPGNNFEYHLIPFLEGAFPAGTAQIMPYYGIPVDQTSENVAFGFNRDIITKLLRDSLNFDGVVCTDWHIITDGSGVDFGRPWGVENLTALERMQKSLNAGCDQFGGEFVPELVVELVEKGMITEERIDQSIARILSDKFRLGLFDNPFVDVGAASRIAGNETFRQKGKMAQAKSTILLKNEDLLPLKAETKVYVDGIDDVTPFSRYSSIVKSIEEADVIIKKVKTPYDKRDQYFLENYFHQGRLFFNQEELGEILPMLQQKPTIVIANLERPAILTEINENAKALFVEFGTSDEVLSDLIFGKLKPEGKLPFELPSSWEAVQNQLEDVPYDSKDPLYPFGFGLEYPVKKISLARN